MYHSSDVICKCITTSGATVWVAVGTSEYELLSPNISYGSAYVPMYFPNSIRLHGKVIQAKNVKKELPQGTDNLIIQLLNVERYVAAVDGKHYEVAYTTDIKTPFPVYVDIVSIVPKLTLQKMFIAQNVLCECKTTAGDKLQVYMSVEEYKQFDPDADFHNPGSALVFVDTITYPDGLRIHGTAVDTAELNASLQKHAENTVIVFHSIEK